MDDRTETLAQAMATSLDAMRNCHRDLERIAAGTYDASWRSLREEWAGRWRERLDWLCKNYLPSGSGIDCGTVLDLERSTADRLAFVVEFHHMDDSGCYAGWRTYRVVARPSFIGGLSIGVTGRGPEDTKDYIAECVRDALAETHRAADLWPAEVAK